jgi:hypothetical protein
MLPVSLGGTGVSGGQSPSLHEQFPLKCIVSKNFMPERTTQKVLVYRATYRLTSGQHTIWCNLPPSENVETVSRLRKYLSGAVKLWNHEHAPSPSTPPPSILEGAVSNHRQLLAAVAHEPTKNQKRNLRRRKVPQHKFQDKQQLQLQKDKSEKRVNKKSASSSKKSSNKGKGSKGASGKQGGKSSKASPSFSTTKWNWLESCITHIDDRIDKSTDPSQILSLLLEFDKTPRFCPTTVSIHHFKFIAGVEEYLVKRALSYKSKGLAWWKQSYDIINHIRSHNNSLCVKCPEYQCHWADTGKAVWSHISP